MPKTPGIANWKREYHHAGADRACPWRLAVTDGTTQQIVDWIAGAPGYPAHARCAGSCCMISEGCAKYNGVEIP
jgi:hypothetical protein